MTTRVLVRFQKFDDAERLIIGPLLIPETFDKQDDIVTPIEVRRGAHRFLTRMIGGDAKLGVMHSKFPDGLELVESYVVPTGNTIDVGDETYSEGTWLVVVRILDDEIWRRVQEGELTGFSVGDGTAMAYAVDEESAAALKALAEAAE